MIFNLLSFITTYVYLTAKTHCMTDGLPPSPSMPHAIGPDPSLAARANVVINRLPVHAVVRHLLSLARAA